MLRIHYAPYEYISCLRSLRLSFSSISFSFTHQHQLTHSFHPLLPSQYTTTLHNRYVDLTEAIDAQDASFLDHGDFHDTDAVPLQGPLPASHYVLSEDSREEVRTWVLSVVTDSNIEQRFPPREQVSIRYE